MEKNFLLVLLVLLLFVGCEDCEKEQLYIQSLDNEIASLNATNRNLRNKIDTIYNENSM
jgi:hypothetical protein